VSIGASKTTPLHPYYSRASSVSFRSSKDVQRCAPFSALQSTLSASVQSTHPYKVVAHSPVLGGDIIRIRAGPDEDEVHDSGFLTSLGVPTFAVLPRHLQSAVDDSIRIDDGSTPKRLGLEAILQNPNAFLLTNALSPSICESILQLCEDELGFGDYHAGKNNHGAMQIVIPKEVADAVLSVIGPHVDLEGVADAELELQDLSMDTSPRSKHSYSIAGINRRWRVYRYAPNQSESFAPHIDAGFPPGGVSLDDDTSSNDITQPYLHWDASHQYPQNTVSRLTVLIYLNADFSGGHTKFYSPLCEIDRASDWNDPNKANYCNEINPEANVIASIQPKAGSILIFPQAISEEAVEKARYLWPLHEGSPVTLGKRPKYVIRTDVLFETNPCKEEELAQLPEEDQKLFQYDEAVRQVFLPQSPAFSPLFLHHVQHLYNPHMGVENLGPFLYSFLRFTKRRRIVEVGAGYTTLWILQALKDNDLEMERINELDKEGCLRMLDYPFGTPSLKDWDPSSPSYKQSSLLCIDNCEHQKETASSAVRVAETLGLGSYIDFLRGDAFEALDTHFSEVETIDLLWCDFGVGSRMKEYASNVWKYIKPGGFLLCHSTLTNRGTREWLEGLRARKGAEVTGIPPEEYVELSLLEGELNYIVELLSTNILLMLLIYPIQSTRGFKTLLPYCRNVWALMDLTKSHYSLSMPNTKGKKPKQSQSLEY
jgi:predicted O-methyltransferase YrrM